MFIIWQISTLTGIILGHELPQFLELQFIIPLTFIAIIIPMINSISFICAALSSATTALIFKTLDLNLWILASASIGLIVGVTVSRFDKK